MLLLMKFRFYWWSFDFTDEVLLLFMKLVFLNPTFYFKKISQFENLVVLRWESYLHEDDRLTLHSKIKTCRYKPWFRDLDWFHILQLCDNGFHDRSCARSRRKAIPGLSKFGRDLLIQVRFFFSLAFLFLLIISCNLLGLGSQLGRYM